MAEFASLTDQRMSQILPRCHTSSPQRRNRDRVFPLFLDCRRPDPRGCQPGLHRCESRHHYYVPRKFRRVIYRVPRAAHVGAVAVAS